MPGCKAALLALVLAGSSRARAAPSYRSAMAASRLWQAAQAADAEGRLLEAGRLRLALGDTGAARRDLAAALERSPSDRGVLRELALAYRDEPERALAYAERAGEESLAGRIAWDMDEDAKAREHLTKALARGEDPGVLRALSAADPARSRQWALRASEAAARQPLWLRPAALRLCARLWLRLGDGPQAAADLTLAAAADPEDPDALEGLAELSRAGVRPAVRPAATARPLAAEPLDALRGDDLMAAILDAPAWKQAPAYLMAADRLTQSGRYDDAAGAVKRARELDFNSFQAGRAMSALEAKGFRQDFFPVGEQLEEGYRRLARASFSLGDLARALEYARRAGDRRLEVAAVQALAGAAVARGEFQAALALSSSAVCLGDAAGDRSRLPARFFDLCLSRYPGQARLYVDRGVARHLAGEERGAIADFRKALELKPGYREAAASLSALRGSAKGRQAP